MSYQSTHFYSVRKISYSRPLLACIVAQQIIHLSLHLVVATSMESLQPWKNNSKMKDRTMGSCQMRASYCPVAQSSVFRGPGNSTPTRTCKHVSACQSSPVAHSQRKVAPEYGTLQSWRYLQLLPWQLIPLLMPDKVATISFSQVGRSRQGTFDRIRMSDGNFRSETIDHSAKIILRQI